jgi:uncharacterized protein (DUF2252 family)
MTRFAAMGVADLAQVEIRRGVSGTPVHQILRTASRVTPMETLKSLTISIKRIGHRFHDRPPILRHVHAPMRRRALEALAEYEESLPIAYRWIFQAYQPVDVAFKIVGTGSVGTRDYAVLFFGNGIQDPLILQVKEELPSCYAPFLPEVPPASHEGQRVAEGQKRTQTAADPFLGYTTIEGRHFLVRQLSDHKASIDLATLTGSALVQYAVVCGEVLAKGHARTGDPAAIAGYCGNSTKLDEAIAKFARLYADQTERDYEAFRKAIRKRKVRAVLPK